MYSMPGFVARGELWESHFSVCSSQAPRPEKHLEGTPATGYWQSHHTQMKFHATCLFPDPSEPQPWHAESYPSLLQTLQRASQSRLHFPLLLCLTWRFSVKHLLSTHSVKRYLSVLRHTTGNYEIVKSQKSLLSSEDLQLATCSEGLVPHALHISHVSPLPSSMEVCHSV